MLRTFNLIMIVGFSLFCFPVHAKEISKEEEYLSSSVEKIAEEMINLNSSLDVLSITISNLVPRNSM